LAEIDRRFARFDRRRHRDILLETDEKPLSSPLTLPAPMSSVKTPAPGSAATPGPIMTKTPAPLMTKTPEPLKLGHAAGPAS